MKSSRQSPLWSRSLQRRAISLGVLIGTLCQPFQLPVLWAARAADQSVRRSMSAAEEGRRFLEQFPNTQTPTLADLKGRTRVVPEVAAMQINSANEGIEVYVGDSYAYSIIRSAGGVASAVPQASSPFGRGSATQATSGLSLLGGAPASGLWQVPPGRHIRRFAIFAHCVVRSFYIWRFEQNLLPGDTFGADVPADPLCPAAPEKYLHLATAFSDRFFGL